MAKLIYKKGNILDATEYIIAHGCNCFHIMGAGVALALRNKWPEVYRADCRTARGSSAKLGTYSIALVENHMILNMYTQFDLGLGKADYNAIAQAFTILNNDFLNEETIAIPRIGAGLAGGNWNIIAKIIEESTPDIPEIIVYEL